MIDRRSSLLLDKSLMVITRLFQPQDFDDDLTALQLVVHETELPPITSVLVLARRHGSRRVDRGPPRQSRAFLAARERDLTRRS